MSGAGTASPRGIRPGDVVITLLLLAVFVLGNVLALEWPFRASFFPRLVTGVGVAFAVLKLVGFAVQARRGRVAAAGPAPLDLTVGGSQIISEEEEEDRSIEYVFATAGAKAWAAAVGWVFGFFLLLYVFGVFVAVPVFAFAYLKLSGSAGWLGAALYAGILGGILWLAFSRLLSVPMPAGIL